MQTQNQPDDGTKPAMDEEQPIQGQGLAITLSEDARKLLATYTPVEDKLPFDSEWLKQKITAAGFGQLFLHEQVFAQLIKQYATASDAFTLEIGEVRDASVAVTMATDKMTAYLTVTPPCGGENVTREQISQALQEKQVVSGILDEAIEQVLTGNETEKLLIAQGRVAVNGENGRLQCLIEMARNRQPQLDEHGRVDYRNLGGIVAVHQGERLMQNIAPTAGEAGENVLGQPIPAKPGKAVAFAPKLKGAVIDPADPAFLIAEISGQPVLTSNGMTVEPTITLKTVDLSTGNVDFDGSVDITGDVHAGMRVRATGDIHVGGTVEAARLEAGGDVVIKGGIIGHGEVHAHPPDAENSPIARVRCGGSCSTRFIEDASVEAGDSIMVEELVMQSEVAAVNHIMVGKPGAGKGHIVGGLAEATLLVQTAVIGSSAGVRTRLVVGTNPYLHEKLHHAGKDMAAKVKELDDVIKLLAYIEGHPDRLKHEIHDKAETTRTTLLHGIEQDQQEIDLLTLQLKLAEEAKVVAENAVFTGVQVEIGSKSHNVAVQRDGGAFSLNEKGEIEFQ